MTIAAELLGVPHGMVPDSVAALERYFAGVRPDLLRTPAAAESMSYLLDPPGLDEDIAELWRDIRDAAVLALPGWARQLYGYPEPPPLTAARRTEIRQALGVLDAVFLGEPGVLEARQRIAVRMRSAARSGQAGSEGEAPGDRRGDRRRVGRRADAAAGQAGQPAGPGGSGSSGAWRRCGWRHGGAPATRPARRGCSPARATPGGAAQRPGAADRRGRCRHLGTMKGVLMKLGQMASYVDDGLSPAARRTLAGCRTACPR